MKIAVTYDNGNVFQHFGKTEFFKVYEVEDNKVVSSEVIGSNGVGHGALAGLLADQAVDVLICGGRSKTFGQWQSWVFAAGANGVMTGNYLTTKGCAFCDDAEMYEVLGLREERS